jgi:hypothetical protein
MRAGGWIAWTFALGLALGAAGAGPLAAAPPGAAETQANDAAWTKRLNDAVVRRDRARLRLADAKAAVAEARHRRYPRGAALAELENEREKARAELAEAETALPELIEEARQAGVSPELLLRFEDTAGRADEEAPADAEDE